VERLPQLLAALQAAAADFKLEEAICDPQELDLLDGGRGQLGDRFRPNLSQRYQRPLFTSPVAAGFPSPAEEWIEGHLSLDSYLIRHPAATFHLRVVGDSMVGAGIYPGDVLVVDRSLEHRDGSIVIAVVDGELTVKRFRRIERQCFLVPENPDYPPLLIREEMEVALWGVVVGLARRFEG
jgi:DNA polymerase V